MRRVALVVIAALIASPLATATAAPARIRRTPAPAAAATDALERAFQNGRLSRAQYALERARSLFAIREVRAEWGEVAKPDPHAATLILNELALSLRELSGADRERAEDILARPTDRTGTGLAGPYTVPEAPPVCSDHICVHYVTTSDDAPSSATWHQDTSTIFQEVWDKEITEMGYRAPKSDSTSTHDGGNGKFDVYVQNLGAIGIYGFCSTDDPKLNTNSVYLDLSSYCVVDDDFSPAEYAVGANGLDAMRVTAAHEFFHAVQYGYDATEDSWLKEATASWIEDEVYDTIDDNVAYLRRGPLVFPHIPLDTTTEGTEPYGSYEYGAWVFFRHLSESNLGATAIRDIWTRLDSKTRDFRNNYSLKALQQMAAAQGTSVRDLHALFAAEALAPTVFFEEGAENSYPSPAVARTVDLTTTAPLSPSANVNLDHLSSRHIAFTPGADVAADQRMTIAVDLPDLVKGSEARVVVMKSGVAPTIEPPITLDSSGKGSANVEFGRGSVERVVLVLSNGSIRFGSDCFRATTVFSCGGATPTDDNQIFAYAAQLGDVAPPVTGTDSVDVTPPRITNVTDGPDPFRVNGRRTIRIGWALGEDAFMKLTITNPGGTKVLSFSRTIPADSYFFEWNGVYRRRLVKAGKYTYRLTATDAAGNRSAVKKGTFTVKR